MKGFPEFIITNIDNVEIEMLRKIKDDSELEIKLITESLEATKRLMRIKTNVGLNKKSPHINSHP